jgi:hypothetical protein
MGQQPETFSPVEKRRRVLLLDDPNFDRKLDTITAGARPFVRAPFD